MTRIELQNVRITSDARLRASANATLEGHRIALIGENGSGKSSLLLAIAGLAHGVTGTVLVDGIDAARERKRLRSHVGVVFTNPAVQAVMPTVREDVELTLRGRGLTRVEQTELVQRALDAHELTALAERSVYELSGGQQQRLALCSVLVASPSLVVADEPTTLLDARHRAIIADRLLGTGERPAAHDLVLATHDLELAERCDVAVLVADGAIVRVGDPAGVIAEYRELLQRPQS